MKRHQLYLTSLSLLMLAQGVASPLPPKPVSPLAAEPIPLSHIRLLDGPFKRSQDVHARYLLSLSPDRLVARFRVEAGLKPKADAYPGWESVELPGVGAGFYLSGCSRTYAATGDRRFLDRVRYVLDELQTCQQAHGNGFLLATKNGKRLFEEIERGDIRYDGGWLLNGQPEPYYALEKLLSGLRDSYRVAGQRKGLTIAIALANWLDHHMAHLSDDQMQRIMACEFGGMNWVLADLYADTGDARYLALSRRWQHRAILDPLAREEDILPGKHANTQFPKISGLAARYPYTGDPADRITPAFFWERVAHHHSYATGGNSLGEHFGPPDRLRDRLGPNTAENCNAWNMLRLTSLLFCIEPRAEYADYAERVLWNHILAAQNPADGAICYFLPLATGAARTYEPLYGRFACCTCSGFDSYARHGDSLYYTSGDTLFVNQYIASEARWQAKGVTLRQETRIPYGEPARFTFRMDSLHRLRIAFRCPAWASEGMFVTVNGQKQPVSAQPGSYLVLSRPWRNRDVVTVRIPAPIRTESMPDDPRRIAFFKGPVLLAGDLGPASLPEPERAEDKAVILDERLPAEVLKPVRGRPLTYRIRTASEPVGVVLSPFFALHGRRTAVYWDVMSRAGWSAHLAELAAEKARLRSLDARTVDRVEMGIAASEAAHDMKGERTNTGFGAYGQHMRTRWRDASAWFEYALRVPTETPAEVLCTYWGREQGARTFDVLVDGVKIATESLDGHHPEAFYDATYAIPPDLMRGKTRVRVRFQAHPGNMAGGLFGLRLLRTSKP